MLGKYVFPEIHSQRQIHETSSNISQYFTRGPHIQTLNWYNKHTSMGIIILKYLTCLISCLFVGSPCTYEFFGKNGKAYYLWDVNRPVKIRHLLEEEGFHHSQFFTIIVLIKNTLLTSSPNYFKYEKSEVKRIPIHFYHHWTKDEQNFTTKFSHVRLLRTEKIPSFNCTHLLPGIYLLFHNLFKNNS